MAGNVQNGLKMDPSGNFVDYNSTPSTFAALPLASLVPPGVRAWTTDAGDVYSDGAGWRVPSNAIVPAISTSNTAAQNTAAIQLAIDTAFANGGGTVLLPALTITLSSSLTPRSGVQVIGQNPRYSYTAASIPDDRNVLLGAGTILQGNGTFAAFSLNKTALGIPASQNAFAITAVTNAVFKGIGFTNFTRGFDCGNTNNGSFWYSLFEDLSFIGCTQWGFWITNFQHCTFRRLFAVNNTVGQIYLGNDVPTATLAPGNSVWEDIYCCTPASNTSRSFVMETIQGNQNEGSMTRIQSNRFGVTTVTQAATMANGVANITVTDGTKFAVNMPVTVATSQNGFVAGQNYFLISVAGNVIQLSDTYGGSAKLPSGNTAVNITTLGGFPCIEMAALAGATITAHTLNNVDTEGGGNSAILWQNVSQSHLLLSQAPTSAQSKQTLCFRGSGYNTVISPGAANRDWDGNSSTSMFIGTQAAGSVGSSGMGVYYDQATSQYRIDFNGNYLVSKSPDGTNCLFPVNAGLGVQVSQFGNASNALAAQHSGICDAVLGSASTFTLPTINAAMSGVSFMIVNGGASGNLTVNTSSSQLFNKKAALTSITVGTAAAMTVTAVSDNNGNYWAVTGIGGTYAAGTITGL